MNENLDVGAQPTLTVIQSTHASLGGLKQSGLLERHGRLLAEYGKAFHVELYTCDMDDYSTLLGVEHHPVPWLPRRFGWRHLVFYLWLLWWAPRMKGVIKVFGSNIPTLPLVRLLSRRPMMVTYQFDYVAFAKASNPDNHLKAIISQSMESLALASADLVLVTTPALQCKVQHSYGKPTLLSRNWVDVAQSHGASGQARDPRLILYGGRLHPMKGVDVLIRAFARLKETHREARLVICGTGEEGSRLRSLVSSLSVRGVEFQGTIPNHELLMLMARAAIFVLPTVTMEGHPKALIEAMVCGAACVASNVAGNCDIVVDGWNGLLVPPEDVEALSGAMARLLDDASLRLRLARNGQAEAARYDLGLIVPQEMRALLALNTDAKR